MTKKDYSELLNTLKARFDQHQARHRNITWKEVEEKLVAHPAKLSVLLTMEQTGGEPDVIAFDGNSRELFFCDCSAESPAGRRSLCYDRAGLESRKEHQPADCATDMAAAIGIDMLTEEQYRTLQQFGEFDKKTSSWIQTPASIRTLGGALFCDRRYDQVFVYHNGAQSYYGARGFRGVLKV